MSIAPVTPQVQPDKRAPTTPEFYNGGGSARQVQFAWLMEAESNDAREQRTKESSKSSPRGTRRRRRVKRAGSGASTGRSDATPSGGSNIAMKLPPSSIDINTTVPEPLSPRQRSGAGSDQPLHRPDHPPLRNGEHAQSTANAKRPGQQPLGTRDEDALLSFAKAFEVENGRLPSSEEDWQPMRKTRGRVLEAMREAQGRSAAPAVVEIVSGKAPQAPALSRPQPAVPPATVSSNNGEASGGHVHSRPVRAFSSELPSATRMVRTFSNDSHGLVRPQPRRMSDAVQAQASTTPPRKPRQRWFSTPLRLPTRESGGRDTQLSGVHQSSPDAKRSKSMFAFRSHGFHLGRSPSKDTCAGSGDTGASTRSSATWSEGAGAARPNRWLDPKLAGATNVLHTVR